MITPAIRRTVQTAAVALLLAAGAGAGLAAQEAHELRILVISENREDLGYVNPGGVLTLQPGAHVRLRMQSIYGGNHSPRYPSARFTDSKGYDAVYITGGDQQIGNAKIEVATRPRNRDEVLYYQILDQDKGIPARMMKGSFTIRVASEGRPGGGSGPIVPPGGSNSSEQELVRALYRGILLREPDDSGYRTALDKLRREGRSAVIEVARDIANSQESRYGVYDRTNVSHQQRLNAMYENLLGLSPDRVDRDQYNGDFERIARGDIGRVVEGMVRSERFRERFDLAGIRY
jgi:hypothetical protein